MPELEIHPEALRELSAATGRYADLAGRLVADRFVDEIESAFSAVVSAPGIWNVVEEPGVRRYLVHRFPYAVYYRWERDSDRVVVHAVMHLSRRPGYWRGRTGRSRQRST